MHQDPPPASPDPERSPPCPEAHRTRQDALHRLVIAVQRCTCAQQIEELLRRKLPALAGIDGPLTVGWDRTGAAATTPPTGDRGADAGHEGDGPDPSAGLSLGPFRLHWQGTCTQAMRDAASVLDEHVTMVLERIEASAAGRVPDHNAAAAATNPVDDLSLNLDLSTRQREVLVLLLAGLTNGEIGARMFISARTVEKHVSAILRQTGHHSRATLIASLNHHRRPGSGAKNG